MTPRTADAPIATVTTNSTVSNHTDPTPTDQEATAVSTITTDPTTTDPTVTDLTVTIVGNHTTDHSTVTSDAPADLLAEPSPRVTQRRVVASEWYKFRTVRSNLTAIGGAAVAAVAFGALFSSLAGSDDGPGRLVQDSLSLSLGGFQLSQIIIAILGVAIVAGEYQTGLIRTWFGAAPDRLRVLFAKVGVFGAATFAVMTGAAFAAFVAGQALLPDSWTALSLTDDGVLQALFGVSFYCAAIGVIGVGLGFLLRSTAAGAGAVVTTLMIAPLLANLLPDSIGDPIGMILPSNAGTALQGLSSNTELLSAGWGFVALCAWVVAIVGAAAISLRRRDA